VKLVQYIFISCDEVCMKNNQSWVGIHVYVMQWCVRLSIFLCFSQLINGFGYDNMTSMITETLVSSSISTPNITSKWIYFNVDGVLAFQGLKNVVTDQIYENGV